ncbi:diacylglycerol/polyprenol kinase family protein [uncultured Victivallis sp.]|uniref:diacylglycerol/polyprenol kinase family protein n=1 Tax=uncultured Victivallis sp. TaxID=354118 RepID=UPI002601273E|nr:diacylglycerol/polyprenol kinase family protein [uncultured Victivallis sp.]
MPGIEITYGEELKRKLIHLSSLWMVFAVYLIPSRPVAAGLFAFLLAATLISEHAYACGWPVLAPLYGFLFGRMLRKKPEPGAWIVSGGSYVLMAALLVTVLYEREAAGGAMTVMLTGDAAAALIGRRFGRHKAPNNKSWEGVAAFLVVSGIALGTYLALIGAPAALYLGGAIALFPACAAELFERQLHVDDNFSIPVVVGAGLQIALFLSRAEGVTA